MGIIGGELGYRILKRISRNVNEEALNGGVYKDRSKLEVLFGSEVWERIRGRLVIDFGCGAGAESVLIARMGARRVIGLDIQEHFLEIARATAIAEGVADRCTFVNSTDELAEVIISLDAFEHFDDPAGILREMRTHLASHGRVLISFGPPWLHPLGGHLFSVFPWAHLLFTERSLIRWRADFKHDGATRFNEVAGGLNQMTIRRFHRLIADSPFTVEHFEAVPIRRLAIIANRVTREWTTAVVRCVLVPKA